MVVGVGRRSATVASEGRVARLVELLFVGVRDDHGAIAEVARDAGLEHETVRRLMRNPGDRRRTSPGFFVVAAIARARGLSLDTLAAQTLDASGGER